MKNDEKNSLSIFDVWDDQNSSITTVFESAVQRTPHKTAIIDGDYQIDFKTTNIIVNQIASALRKVNKSNKPIAIYINKSYQYILGSLAILKSGHAYIHIDADYSMDIIETIISENDPEIILTTTSMASTDLSKFKTKTFLIDQNNLWKDEPQENFLNAKINSYDTAIIGYTSGTTGKPKGVAVSHRACLYAFCKFWNEIKDINETDRFGYVTYLAWDALSPLLFNSTGIIIPDEINSDLEKIVAYLKRYSINHAFFTPSLLLKIINTIPFKILEDSLKNLRVIWLGGEIVNREIIIRMHTLFPKILLLNNYGPTEFFVVSQGLLTINDLEIVEGIPAGHILPEIRYILLDENLQDVTEQNEGFLYVSGPAIANGYVNNEPLTKEKFITINNCLFYSTGDYVKILNDTRMVVLARKNFILGQSQSKVFLKDIENKFKEIYNIEECAAIKTSNQAGDEIVKLFYVSKNNFKIIHSKSILMNICDNIEIIKVDNIPIHPVSSKIYYSKLMEYY